jgi:hypothetical protein
MVSVNLLIKSISSTQRVTYCKVKNQPLFSVSICFKEVTVCICAEQLSAFVGRQPDVQSNIHQLKFSCTPSSVNQISQFDYHYLESAEALRYNMHIVGMRQKIFCNRMYVCCYKTYSGREISVSQVGTLGVVTAGAHICRE